MFTCTLAQSHKQTHNQLAKLWLKEELFLKACFWKPPTNAANALISHLLRMCCSYIRLLKPHTHRGPINDCVTHQKQTVCPLTVKYLQCFPYLLFNHFILLPSFEKIVQFKRLVRSFDAKITMNYCNDFNHLSIFDNCWKNVKKIQNNWTKIKQTTGFLCRMSHNVSNFFWMSASCPVSLLVYHMSIAHVVSIMNTVFYFFVMKIWLVSLMFKKWKFRAKNL